MAIVAFKTFTPTSLALSMSWALCDANLLVTVSQLSPALPSDMHLQLQSIYLSSVYLPQILHSMPTLPVLRLNKGRHFIDECRCCKDPLLDVGSSLSDSSLEKCHTWLANGLYTKSSQVVRRLCFTPAIGPIQIHWFDAAPWQTISLIVLHRRVAAFC